jgi:hypothetical protein
VLTAKDTQVHSFFVTCPQFEWLPAGGNFTPKRQSAVSGNILSVMRRGVPLEFSRERSQMLLNILECTKQPPSPHKEFCGPNVNSMAVKKPWLSQRKFPCLMLHTLHRCQFTSIQWCENLTPLPQCGIIHHSTSKELGWGFYCNYFAAYFLLMSNPVSLFLSIVFSINSPNSLSQSTVPMRLT